MPRGEKYIIYEINNNAMYVMCDLYPAAGGTCVMTRESRYAGSRGARSESDGSYVIGVGSLRRFVA